MADELPLSHSPTTAQRSPLRLAAGFALLTPALVCCAAQLAFPTFQTFVSSFQKVNFLSPPAFVGLDNYSALLGNRAVASALGFSLTVTVVRVLVVAFVPLMLALGANALGRAGRLTVRVLFTLPLALFMPVTIALAWQVLFAGQRLRVLNTPAQATVTLVLIDSIYTLGLACGLGLIFFLAALRGGGHGRSWTPLLVAWGGGIAGTIALSLQSFTFSFLLTRGGPVNATATLMLDYYQMAFQNFRIGPASALGVLLLIGLAVPGILVGAAVVFTRLRLTTTAEADQAPEPLLGKPLGIVSLVVALLLALPACALSVAPIPAIVTASLTDDAYGRFIESIPFGNVTMNTVLPVLLSALIQTLITYLGALGIGGLRPLGRRSELLLLLFSPWLFVSVRPLTAAIFMGMQTTAQALDSFFVVLIPPMWLNVPMLFILTMFFKGQAAHREGAGRTSSLILPSLPLTAFLFCAALWANGQDLWWPLIAARGPQFYTAQIALTLVAARFITASGPVAAGLVLFSLPSFLFFFLVFSLFQVFYLERLRLEAGEEGAAAPADQAPSP